MAVARPASRLANVTSVALFLVAPFLMVVAAGALRASGRLPSRATLVARVQQVRPLAEEAAQAEGVPPALLLALITVESGGRPDAVSPAGAVGLLQLMPATAGDMAREVGLGAPELRDPETSLRLGARYLARQLRRFESLPRGRELALAAYNAGPARVTSWARETPPPEDFDAFIAWIRFPETRSHVSRVVAWERVWREYLERRPQSP